MGDKKRAFLKECNTIFNPEKIGCVDATKGSIVIYLKDGTKKLSVSDLEKKVEDKIKTVEEIDGHSTKFTHNYNHAEPEGVQEYLDELQKAKDAADKLQKEKEDQEAAEKLQQEKQQREKEETDKLQKEKDDQEAAEKLKQEKQQREKEETDKLQKEKDDQEAADKLQQEKQQREKEETDKL